jgi:hypothetical protein
MKPRRPQAISKNFLAVAAENATGIHFVSQQTTAALTEPTPFQFIPQNPPAPWHAKLSARRSEPGHCNQCGKPSDRPDKTNCTKCKDKAKEAYHERQRRRFIEELVAGDTTKAEWLKNLAAMQRRIVSLESAVARLQLSRVKDYKRVWKLGYSARKAKEQAQGAWEMPTMTKQEAATMSHAYSSKH